MSQSHAIASLRRKEPKFGQVGTQGLSHLNGRLGFVNSVWDDTSPRVAHNMGLPQIGGIFSAVCIGKCVGWKSNQISCTSQPTLRYVYSNIYLEKITVGNLNSIVKNMDIIFYRNSKVFNKEQTEQLLKKRESDKKFMEH